MISLDFNFNILTRDLSHYLENQVKVGLFGSGVGLSLVLGFSAAYTCYYLISVAKVRAVHVCFMALDILFIYLFFANLYILLPLMGAHYYCTAVRVTTASRYIC